MTMSTMKQIIFTAFSILVLAAWASPISQCPSQGTKPVAANYKNMVYFTNWDIYDRNYQPTDLPADKITHVLYGFAKVTPDGDVVLSDPYADIEKHFPEDVWTEDGYNVYGCAKQLFQLKQRNRNVKTLLSIGGWNFRDVFPAAASTESTRAQFASSAVRLLADLGFDGIDIDWEFPSEAEKANNLLLLLQAVRAELDAYSSRVHPENPYHHLLSVGGSAGSNNYNKLPLADVADTVDFINLMGYDFAGSWSNVTGHQANLFPSTAYPLATPLSISAAVTGYLSAGVPASKIILGMPVYGRAFSNTDGPGKPYHGVGPGHWAEGLWDYKDLPRPGATVFYDATIMAAYSYDESSKEFITYDTPSIVRAKVEWIRKQGLGGSFFYEASGDQTGDASLVGTAFEELGSLEVSENCLEYPESRYDNIRKGPLSARR